MAVKKVFVLAGEASGDILGAEWIQAAQTLSPNLSFTYCGGPAMREVLDGQRPVVPMESMAFMGFAEVLRHLPAIWQNDQHIKAHLKRVSPDIILFVDYPGYNLRLAEWIRRGNLASKTPRMLQLVCPQFWAWKAKRLPRIVHAYDAVYPLLPFESNLLQIAGGVAPYFGHPAAHRVEATVPNPQGPLALLPGSREQEWSQHVSLFAQVAKEMNRAACWYRPLHVSDADYRRMLSRFGVDGVQANVCTDVPSMGGVSAALVASGTATLEVALRAIPMVVAYRTSRISYAIGKRVIRVPYISLVNLILDRPAVKECIQDEANTENLRLALIHAESDGQSQSLMQDLRQAIDRGNPMPQMAAHALASN